MDVLTNSCGNVIEVKENGTVKITGQFTDGENDILDKTMLASLTATLRYKDQVINSRDEQNILDANGGTVDDDGVLTLYLGQSDNVNVESDIDELEPHILTIRWEWTDLSSNQQFDSAQYIVYVQPIYNRSDPQSPKVNDGFRKTIIVGDTYDIDFGIVPKWYWPKSLADYVDGCTATLGAEMSDGTTITKSLAIDATANPVVVYAEFTAAQTGVLEVGKYRYDVQVTFPSGEKKTLASGPLSIIASYTA